jgi:hypothetical protein
MNKRDRTKVAATLALAEANSNAPDGERIAAINAAERLLNKAGLRLRDLAEPSAFTERQMPEMGTWRETCRRCLGQRHALRAWEVNFLTDVQKFRRISPKQRWIVDEVAIRLGVKPARSP